LDESRAVRDVECVQLLQWCLPRMGLRWPGFRKVRRQVCKRIGQRMAELGLADTTAYRAYLERQPDEWRRLDEYCRITISRFYRDRVVFQFLEREVVPRVADGALARGARSMQWWSIGCASGEEAYTLAILWREALASRYPALSVEILATDVEPSALARAETGCFQASSLKDLPQDWRDAALERSGDRYCVKRAYRELVTFGLQDIRCTLPDRRFDLVLCRNVAFTYFDETVQRSVLGALAERLVEGGALVVGSTERLPEMARRLEPWSAKLGVYRKSAAFSRAL
jgi:chemotaxis protein methyltransferase CheR